MARYLPYALGGAALAYAATRRGRGRRQTWGMVPYTPLTWKPVAEAEGEEAQIPGGGSIGWGTAKYRGPKGPTSYMAWMVDGPITSYLIKDPEKGEFLFYPESVYNYVSKAYHRGDSPEAYSQYRFKSAKAVKEAAQSAWERLERYQQAGHRGKKRGG